MMLEPFTWHLRFSVDAYTALATAELEAEKMHLGEVGTESLLLVLLEQSGIALSRAREEVEKMVKTFPYVPEGGLQLSRRMCRILFCLASASVQHREGSRDIEVNDLWRELLNDYESVAQQVLMNCNVDIDAFRKRLGV